MRKMIFLAGLAGTLLAAAGCVVHERAVVTERPAAPCPGAVWVEEGHNSHWDCPHERVEVQVKP